MGKNKKAKKKKTIGLKRGYIDGSYSFFVIKEKKHQTIDYHYHTFHKCLIVLSGQVTYTVEGRVYDLKAGDVLWIPSYEAHKVEISGTTTYKRCVVYLSDGFLAALDAAMATTLRRRCDELGNLMDVNIRVNSEAFDLIPASSSYLDPKNRLGMLGDFVKFLGMILEANKAKPQVVAKTSKSQQTIDMAATYIQNNAAQKISVKDVADHCFVSQYYLMHQFKTSKGLTIYQFLTAERLYRARVLMREGHGLTEIAYQVGFANYSSFVRAFVKSYGMSPKKFRSLEPTGENI